MGKVKEYYKNGFFSDILVFTSLFHIIEITKNFHFGVFKMNTI